MLSSVLQENLFVLRPHFETSHFNKTQGKLWVITIVKDTFCDLIAEFLPHVFKTAASLHFKMKILMIETYITHTVYFK